MKVIYECIESFDSKTVASVTKKIYDFKVSFKIRNSEDEAQLRIAVLGITKINLRF